MFRNSIEAPSQTKIPDPAKVRAFPQMAKKVAITPPTKKTVKAYRKSTDAIASAPVAPCRHPRLDVV
jgi:hypothetical protein